MPVITPETPTAPYDTCDAILNVARTRLNDAIASIGGDVLQDSQPFTQSIFNTAYQKMQEFLDNLGYATNTSEVILYGLPVVANLDPAGSYWLSWTQVFDGVNYYNSNVLPQTLLSPLKLWERIAGQQTEFCPMELWLDGLPDRPKRFRNHIWEWRGDVLYMPGSQYSMDLRIRFKAFKPDIVTVGAILWYQQPVPFIRCRDALSNYVCYEVASARGDLDAQSFQAAAEAAAQRMMNRDISRNQRKNIRRRPRSSHSGRGTFDCF